MEIFDDLNLVLQLNQHIQAVSNNSNEDRSSDHAKTITSELASFRILTTLESVNYTETRKDAQFDHQHSTFSSMSVSDLPYHLQGDVDFNISTAMKRRKALRFSETIRARIKFIWEVAGGRKQAEMAQCTRLTHQEEDEQAQQRDHWSMAENKSGQLFPPIEALDEHDYTALMLLVFKVLRDDFVLESALKQIQCDWDVDSQHEKSLSYDKFFLAMFELVDVWTCDMEEITYDRFLNLLARRITQRVVVYLDGTELKLSLSNNFEQQMVVKAIPLQTVPKFVSVARVVAAIGMTTVGELASAAPAVIEQSRIEFIQRNKGLVASKSIGEMRKIGQDLQTLLEMFKSIALQYKNSNYALDKDVLHKIPNTVDFRPHLGVSSGQFEKSGVDHQLERISTKVESDTAIRIISEFGKIDDSNLSQDVDDLSSSLMHDNNNTSTIEIARLGAKFDSVRDAAGNYDTQLISIGRNAGEGSKGCLKPINTIYDLQLADARVINALRSTFIIEKAILIKRQTELSSIINELVKFGVNIDVTRLPEGVIRDRYDTLYDLLIVREGESLKSLAAVILEQIKVELSIHGIIVDDEEAVEEVYDGFFESVLTGTGDSIIEAAQSWVQDTIRGNKVSEYIKHDYHELTSIEKIETLGTNIEDEEFLALLTKDADIKDKGNGECNVPSSKNVFIEDTVDMNTPTVHKMSSISLDRADAVSVDTSNEFESGSFDLVKTSENRKQKLTHQDGAPAEDVQRKTGTRQYKDATRKKDPKSPLRASNRVSDFQKDTAPTHSKEDRSLSKDHHYENLVTISQNFKPLLPTQSGQAQAPVVVNKVADDSSPSSSKPRIETTNIADVAFHNDAKRNQLKHNLRHGRPDTESKIGTTIDLRDHRNISEQHTARNGLKVANVIKEEDTGQNAVICVDLERSVSMDPKMPQIVISGARSAKNIPITGRYIQLLGFGTVVITKDERELFDLLQLRNTDLVCFDIGTDLDTAVTKLQLLQHQVGNRVILLGGNKDEPNKTQQIALECLAHGALYFATIPLNFPRLRESILSFFEKSKQPYILRQRKPPAQAAQVGREFDVAALSLPSLSVMSRENPPYSHHSIESRHAELTPIAPDTPRSLPLRNRPTRFYKR